MASVSWHQGNTSAPTVTLTVTQQSQSIANNTSTVAYSLVISRPSNISSSAAKAYSVVINGTTVSSGNTTIGGSGDKTIASGTTTISHNSDGTKAISFSFSLYLGINWGGTALGTASGSGTMTLSTIARASTPTLSKTTFNIGETITIYTNRASSSFTHEIFIQRRDGLYYGAVVSNVGTSWTWDTSNLNIVDLYAQCPNSTSYTANIILRTWNGNTEIGDKTIQFTANVPSSVVPVISNVSITEATEGIASKFNGFVQNKSKLAVAITASGARSSTITKYETYIQAAPYREASFTSAVITASGTVGVVTTVTDSRGRTTQVSNSITVIPYTAPVINSMKAWRIDTSGSASDDGNRIAVAMKFAISSVNNLNDHTYTLKYKQSGANDFTTFANGEASWSYDDTQYFTTAPEISIDNAHIIRLEITDYFQTVAYDVEIPTAFSLMDFRSTGKGIAFGKVSEADEMEIALDVKLTGELIQEERQTPTLQNGWVNYGAAYESASYWKDSCGVVHLAGMIKGGTHDAETVIFTLPTGYRPRTSEKFLTVSSNVICVLDIYGTGNVAIKTGASSGWLSLSGISFRAN